MEATKHQPINQSKSYLFLLLSSLQSVYLHCCSLSVLAPWMRVVASLLVRLPCLPFLQGMCHSLSSPSCLIVSFLSSMSHHVSLSLSLSSFGCCDWLGAVSLLWLVVVLFWCFGVVLLVGACLALMAVSLWWLVPFAWIAVSLIVVLDGLLCCLVGFWLVVVSLWLLFHLLWSLFVCCVVSCAFWLVIASSACCPCASACCDSLAFGCKICLCALGWLLFHFGCCFCGCWLWLLLPFGCCVVSCVLVGCCFPLVAVSWGWFGCCWFGMGCFVLSIRCGVSFLPLTFWFLAHRFDTILLNNTNYKNELQ